MTDFFVLKELTSGSIFFMAASGLLAQFNKLLGGKKSPRPPFEPAFIYLFLALTAYSVADLTIMQVRPSMLPTEAPPKKPSNMKQKRKSPRSDYYIIAERNIFNSDGKIPPALSAEENDTQDFDAPASPSSLPLTLMGTIVHANPGKSVASILSKSTGKVKPYTVDSEIERLAKVTKIERRKVTFRNLNNNRLEYIEIPKDLKLNFGISSAPVSKGDSGLVKSTGRFQFTAKRSDVDRLLEDLPSILKEARVQPNYTGGAGGKINGFRFVWIKPGGIFDKLGFKTGDVIKGAFGEQINSPQKAMEAFQALRGSNEIRVDMMRDGKNEEFNYTLD